MTWFTARPSAGVAVDGRGVSGARRSGVLRCAEAPILGFAGLALANRSVAKAFHGLIAALNVGTFMGREQNGESRVRMSGWRGPMERRLNAVLCADMVGFSRLMEKDEEGTIARQNRYMDKVFRPEIANRQGRLVKTTGDGLLADFPSAVGAVQCAIAIQSQLRQMEMTEDESLRMRYRIGVNLGDVIIEDDDIYGDGVNVAARLQTLAEPGAVCISDLVHQTVIDRVDAQFRDLGSQRVKNISRPIRVWQWILDAPVQRQVPEVALRQRVQFCTSADGTQIAHAEVGEGYPVVRAPHWMSHIEFEWQSAARASYLGEIARHHRLVRFDQRGTGLSDWDVDQITLESTVEDMAAVVDAAGLERFALLGASQGAGFAIRYAADHPDRVACLVILGGYLRGRMVRDDPNGERFYRIGRVMIEEGWGLPDPQYRHFFTSSLIPDAPLEVARSFDEMQRVSSTAEIAVKLFELQSWLDIDDVAARVRAPTLVMHSKDDRSVSSREGQRIARIIPNASFVELPGNHHMLWQEDEAFTKFFEEMDAFIAEHTAGDSVS